MRLCKVIGVKAVVSKLKTHHAKQAKVISTRLKRAGLYLQRQSQSIVPVDKGNLKNSAFTRNIGGVGFDTDIVVGYTAEYATAVHENLDAQHKPGKTAKYLERPIRENRKELLQILRGLI